MSQQLDPTITQKIEEIAKLPATEILQIWERAAEFAKTYVETEQALRRLVVERYGDAGNESGTETIDLNAGYKLKIRKALNLYLADNEEFEAIRSEIPLDMQAQLFTTKTSLVKSAYDKLTDIQKQALAPVVTIKPAMPQVEIVAPKTKE